jgi:hypothetical protein
LIYQYRRAASLLGVIFISLPVFAQTAEQLTARRTMLREARKAKNAGEHARALSLAAQAGEIRMTPSLRFFIAQQQSLLGQLSNAMSSSELCAREAAERRALKKRKDILAACKDLIADLEKSAARITVLLLEPAPPGAHVVINEQVVPEPLYGRPYLVGAGHVRIVASAPGYIEFSHELELEPQHGVELTISLAEDLRVAQANKVPAIPEGSNVDAIQPDGVPNVGAAQTPQSLVSPDVAAVASKKQSIDHTGPYVVLGVGAASLTASVVFLIVRNNAQSSLDALCGGPDHSVCTESPEARSLQSKASTYSVLTDVALGVGGAALVGGGIWLFSEKARGSTASPRAELKIRPIQGGAVVGIAGAL